MIQNGAKMEPRWSQDGPRWVRILVCILVRILAFYDGVHVNHANVTLYFRSFFYLGTHLDAYLGAYLGAHLGAYLDVHFGAHLGAHLREYLDVHLGTHLGARLGAHLGER